MGKEEGSRMKLYLDSCCYNRPFDGKNQLRIRIEASAKMRIQEQIVQRRYKLVTSVILYHENSRNRNETSAEQIESYMDAYSDEYVDEEDYQKIIPLKDEIMKKGLKKMDAAHIACAIYAGCDYFITTDDRILKLRDSRIKVINPTDFVLIEEANK